MQEVSNLYRQILAETNHWFEVSLVIGETGDGDSGYREEQLFSIQTNHRAFSEDTPTVGGAIAGEIDIQMIDPYVDIPKAAKLQLFTRVTDGTQSSEWLKKGVYYVDTREFTKNSDGLDVLTIHGYDAMLKFGQLYPSDNEHDYPLLDEDMVAFVAQVAGVTVDERTYEAMGRNYTFPLMTGYTSREVLGIIAASYGGNFIMSDEGKLLLLKLGSLPPETNYLIDEIGNSILIGDDRILI